jgi:hypothetical protein
MSQHVSASISHALATAALPPSASEAVVETAEVEVANDGEAMVVEIMAETEAVVGTYNNQP